MTKRRKHGLYLLLIAIPIGIYGALNFKLGGVSSTTEAIGVAISSTFGLTFIVGGLVMLLTKKSLGIFNPDDKGRGEDLLASQTKVGDPPISLALNETPSDFDPDEAKEQNQKAIDDLVLKTTDHAIKSIKSLTKRGKPMAKAKTKTTNNAGSVELFQREDELFARKKELAKLTKEVDSEITEVQDNIMGKGWIDKGNGWEYPKPK